jgi:hypothetical protein
VAAILRTQNSAVICGSFFTEYFAAALAVEVIRGGLQIGTEPVSDETAADDKGRGLSES